MADRGRVLYTAHAHVVGGRAAGHGPTSDGVVELDVRAPLASGGDGGGTSPEQLFAVGYAACVESALRLAAKRRRLEVVIDAKVMLMPSEGRGDRLRVTLAVTLPSIHDPVEAGRLARAAHEVCPYSNATRGDIDVALIANGRAVEPAGG